MGKMTFALFFGNRGFFPESLIAQARKEMREALEKAGYFCIIMDENATRYGAVETAEEGRKFAAFLKEQIGNYDGVILSLPNFGDENGAVAALKDCGTPILIQAYPDEIGKMDFAQRRDAFCGKFSVMDVFYQHKLPFTVFKPHVAHPSSENFMQQIDWFASVCRVANRMKRFTVGAIGARTTAFKTIRFDPFWAWNDKLCPDGLFSQLENMGSQNIGGAFVHARGGLCDEYLGPEFMDMFEKCVAWKRHRKIGQTGDIKYRVAI